MTDVANARLDVLFVLDNLSGGGAQRVAVNLANGLVARGHKVRMVLFTDKGELRPLLSPSVQMFDLGGRRSRQCLRPLSRLIRSLRPGAVLGFLPHVNILTILATRLARTGSTIVVTEHNRPDAAMLDLMERGFARSHRLARVVYRFASAVVCCSPGVRDAWLANRHVPAPLLHAILNPIVTDDMESEAAAPPSHPWADDPSIPMIVAAGRLAREKDLPTLLRAFARLRAARPARLVLLGEGDCRPELEALVDQLGLGDDVAMPGFCANPHAMFSRAALFALSSVSEGFPSVVVEALACGTPVVMTDCLTARDRELLGGWVHATVPAGDDSALAHALADALDHPCDPAVLKSRVRGLTVAAATDAYEVVLRGGQAGMENPAFDMAEGGIA
jgi:glycosyltransferase involved in cell wall biosynthesis